MSKIGDLIEKIKRNERQYYLTEMDGEPLLRRAFYFMLCFINLFVSEVRSLRLFTRVASGTYTTMLALIPFVIVGGSLIITFNKEADIPELIKKINELVIPVAGDTIANFLADSLERTLALGLGPVGVISLIVTSVMLFVHIEDAVNDIWHVIKPRAFYLRILLFYAIVTLGPILISYSIFQGSALIPDEIASGFYWVIAREVLMLFAFCTVVFKFLPNIRVNWKSALIPAVASSIFMEVAKFGFAIYLSVAFSSKSNNTIIYGAIAIIPVMLLWLYLTWMVLLFGVECGYCMQNMRSLRLRRCFDEKTSSGETWVFLGPYAAIEVLSAMVRNFCAGGSPMTSEDLAQECIYPVTAIEGILARLENIHVIQKIDAEFATSYILARPLDTIILRDVMRAFDESTPRSHKHPKLGALIEQLVSAQDNIWSTSNANVLREDGVALKDVGGDPTMTNLHVE